MGCINYTQQVVLINILRAPFISLSICIPQETQLYTFEAPNTLSTKPQLLQVLDVYSSVQIYTFVYLSSEHASLSLSLNK